MEKNLIEIVLDNNGIIKPLIIDHNLTNGTGLFNPSVFVDGDKVYFNIRHCQYTLYHAELNRHEHPWGPLLYFNPENDITLTTKNYFGEFNEDFSVKYCNAVDTSKLDVKPLWEFIGLEDARIVKWDNKIYLCGVRRDTTTNGQGRMELSELEISVQGDVKEISRWRIPAPGADNSYCEKNWIPIIDQPYRFLKWCNPVEIVEVNPVEKTCKSIFVGDKLQFDWDLRGGGQVIPFYEGYLSLTHETYLYKSEAGRKDATYRHRLVHWDKNWNVIKKSRLFSFLNAKIEFAAGLAHYKDDILITFGFQDNAAFLVKAPIKVIKDFVYA